MHDRREIDHVLPPTALDAARAGADPVVWTSVWDTMRQVAARDSIVFRTGHVERRWRIAAWLLGLAMLAARPTRGYGH